jgi:hypothetical protein
MVHINMNAIFLALSAWIHPLFFPCGCFVLTLSQHSRGAVAEHDPGHTVRDRSFDSNQSFRLASNAEIG